MCSVGLPDGEGCTVSFLLNSDGLGAVLGGVFFAEVGLGRHVLVVLADEVEAVSSSLVNVPCLTMAGLSPGLWCLTTGLSFLTGACLGLVVEPRRCGEVKLRGLMADPLELRLRGEVEDTDPPDLSVLEDACLSCVALVPRGI